MEEKKELVEAHSSICFSDSSIIAHGRIDDKEEKFEMQGKVEGKKLVILGKMRTTNKNQSLMIRKNGKKGAESKGWSEIREHFSFYSLQLCSKDEGQILRAGISYTMKTKYWPAKVAVGP